MLPTLPWLLSGPNPDAGSESLSSHLERLGLLPEGGPWMLEALAESGLRGRGGARFPTARKWDAVARRARGRPIVVVNGAEGEPASEKDQALMCLRPHLVLDGAQVAAETVGAREVILCVNRDLPHALGGLKGALAERSQARMGSVPVRLLEAPARYVAGEETAAVNWINGGESKPRFIPPRPFEKGVAGRPTLIHNVETLAAAALIARFGPAWFRSAGTAASPGSMLVTVGGAVRFHEVLEVEQGSTVGDAIAGAGGTSRTAQAVLLGGYFGTWVPAYQADALRLDDESAARANLRLGCGVVHVLPEGACGVIETARILRYLASESAHQCGPCMYGLDALARTVEVIGMGGARARDFVNLERWTDQLRVGRGSCKHPDGAVGLLQSAWSTFRGDFEAHRKRPCPGAGGPAVLPVPRHAATWK
jgi:NADH:ubiquinone oxidoreductase subunit F (NADH-binding)